VANAAVFDGIAEGFLQNSKEAKRNAGRQSGRQVVGSEINLHFLLRLEFLTEAFRFFYGLLFGALSGSDRSLSVALVA
jgi:hypothetical protein